MSAEWYSYKGMVCYGYKLYDSHDEEEDGYVGESDMEDRIQEWVEPRLA